MEHIGLQSALTQAYSPLVVAKEAPPFRAVMN